MNVTIIPYGNYEIESSVFSPDKNGIFVLIKGENFCDMLTKVADAESITIDGYPEYSIFRGISDYRHGVTLMFAKNK